MKKWILALKLMGKSVYFSHQLVELLEKRSSTDKRGSSMEDIAHGQFKRHADGLKTDVGIAVVDGDKEPDFDPPQITKITITPKKEERFEPIGTKVRVGDTVECIARLTSGVVVGDRGKVISVELDGFQLEPRPGRTTKRFYYMSRVDTAFRIVKRA